MAEIVEALSDSLDPEPPPGAPAGGLSQDLADEDRPSVLRISLADKLDNVRAIVAAHRHQGDAFWERPPLDDTLWYYGSLADIFSRKLPGPMAESSSARSPTCRAEGRGRSGRLVALAEEALQLLGELVAGGQRPLVALAPSSAACSSCSTRLRRRGSASTARDTWASKVRAADSSSSRSSSTPPTRSNARSRARVPLALVMPAA